MLFFLKGFHNMSTKFSAYAKKAQDAMNAFNDKAGDMASRAVSAALDAPFAIRAAAGTLVLAATLGGAFYNSQYKQGPKDQLWVTTPEGMRYSVHPKKKIVMEIINSSLAYAVDYSKKTPEVCHVYLSEVTERNIKLRKCHVPNAEDEDALRVVQLRKYLNRKPAIK
jgi:hypothetical protein